MIRLRTLGGCVIHVGDAVVGPEAERLFGVLLYLVTERGRRVARRTLQDLLWPDAGEENGRHNLRQAIYKLRQAGVELGGGSRDVSLDPDQIAHDPFDVLAADAATAGDALLSGQLGEFLAGYSPTFSEPYAAWVEAQRAYAHARVARAAVGAMLERRARGRWEDVERLAQLCLEYDPLNEEATLALAEASALAGSKARALAILDQYLAELGDSTAIQLPATLLRRRIAERLPDPAYTVPSDAAFAGRDESLRYLHELFGHARAGRGQSCMVVGEAGVGKSRLAAEFARVATLQGAQVHRMACHSRDRVRPLALFVDGVAALLKLPGALGCSPRSMSYLKRIIEFDPHAAAASEDSREADQLYAGVRGSVLDLLDAIVGERTLLLVVDDVHWADAASWDVLRDMIGWVRGRRVLLVLTSRVAQIPSAELEQAALRVHHLAPLDRGASTRVLAALVGERQRRLSETQHDWLLRAANGNPLFLRELAIHWLETGREGAVPPSLSALLRARLDRLTPLALRVFQTCALMGAGASFERLELVLQYKRHEVLDALQELEAAGLLQARAGGVQSRHELLAEAAVAAMSEAVGACLHRQIALALEPSVLALGPGDASSLWACAEHWRAAGDMERAFNLALSCGAYLLEVGRPAEAADVFESSDRYAATVQQRQARRVGLATALGVQARWNEARALLREAIDAAAMCGTRGSELATLHAQCLDADFLVDGNNAQLLSRAQALAGDQTIAPDLRLQFAVRALTFAEDLCQIGEMHATFSAVAPLLQHRSTSPAHRARVELIYNAVCGDLDRAEIAASTLVEHFSEEGRSVAERCRALRNAAYLYRRTGRLEQSELLLHEAVGIAEEHDLVYQAHLNCILLAEHQLRVGNLNSAAEWDKKAQRWTQRSDDRLAAPMGRCISARVALAEGRAEEAFKMYPDSAEDILKVGSPLRRAAQAAVHIEIRLKLGSLDGSAPIVADFLQTVEMVRGIGEQDHPVYVAYLLGKRTDGDKADYDLRTYVRDHRRDRGPLPVFLRPHARV